MGELYDVLSVADDDSKISFMGESKTMKNAEAIEMMAIERRGCDDCFYVIVPHGKFKKGDVYTTLEASK